MAEGGDYCDADVYDCQVKAKKIFFEDQLPHGFKPLPKKDRPSSMPKEWTGPVYDITGFHGQQVVAVLSQIVNDRNQFKKGRKFYLLIRNSSGEEAENEQLYALEAQPTTDQPGNGRVFLRPKGKVEFDAQGKSYQALNNALKAHYRTNTAFFAEHIKKLLKDNTQNKDVPEHTFEAYIILLFEIARRLVKIENPSERKEAFDELPIGSAIAGFIKLLESGDCRFAQVFPKSGKFHCFSDPKPDVRREAIKRINDANAITGTAEQLLEELQELFCSVQRPKEIPENIDQLTKKFKDVDLNKTSSDEES